MKDYTIGLDIGTNSVGWAVLTEDYNLVRRRMKVSTDTGIKKVKKNFWGVRLFDEGQVSKDTRLKRTTRRRLRRRRNRLIYLQKIFMPEIMELDANFFARLNESFLVTDDKNNPRHPIFGTLKEEREYHGKFPTIYHLRQFLADSPDKADLRLIYLALAHIVKFRGHFLIEGELNLENSSIQKTFSHFLNIYSETTGFQAPIFNKHFELDTVEKILKDKVSRMKKVEDLLSLFPNEKSNGMLGQFLKLIVGNQGNFKTIFKLTEDAKIQFNKEEYDEDLENLLNQIGDEYTDLFVAAKNVYEAMELANILTMNQVGTKAKLSSSMIKRYDEHRDDLSALKKYVKLNLPHEYNSFFKDKKTNGYAGYIEDKTTQAEFYSFLKKKLFGREGAEMFLTKIENENFLRKQRAFDNGVIPHQVHLKELQAIIKQQATYYPFLEEHKEKIEAILTFRIPYYVGPLAKGQSRFAWIERTTEQAIRPWNMSENVDLIGSAVEFIDRMTNYDTYLPDEKVLPKHSMLYETYMVYNELTKVTYCDERGIMQNFSGSEKRDIFTHLFKNERKVTKKMLENYLFNIFELDSPKIKGIETAFNAGLKTYHDFNKGGISKEILNNPENQEAFEEIVKILTVFEDRKMIHQQLEKYESLFSKDIVKKLERRHYTGWGRFSKKLLIGIRDYHSQKTILDYLIEDDGVKKNLNRNFMQLITDKNLSFKKTIEKNNLDESLDIDEVVQNLPGSPAIKKGIRQSLKIVQEIRGIMGYPPTNIVVEMARENQTTERGKRASEPRLKKLEEALKGGILKDNPVTNEELQNDRLYLYYLQNGRDMYTNAPLDINKLWQYDIDHIIPQSFVTDNSFDNRVLVASAKNRGKLDDVPSKEVVDKMKPFWNSLHRSKLISDRKLNSLTKGERGGLEEKDKVGFIKRQLVETRQITKHVAGILQQQFNSQKNSEDNQPVRIITLKSALTSQFRKDFKLFKVREVNDYHHAHDAYLNGVIATTLLKVYPKLEPEFVYGDYRKFDFLKEQKATEKKWFYSNIMNCFKETLQINEDKEILWDQKRDISTIRKVLNYHQMNIVKKTEIQTGSFSKESILQKGPSKKLVPRKTGWNTAKYGGFDSQNMAYSILFSHEKGKNRKVINALIGITIMERTDFEKNSTQFLKNKGYINPILQLKFPKYTLYEFYDGRQRMLASANEAQKGNQMILPNYLIELLYHSKNYVNNSFDANESYAYIKRHLEDFSDLLTAVKAFAEQYTLAPERLEQIEKLYEKNKDEDIKKIATSFVNLMQFNKMGAPAKFEFFGEPIERKRYTNVKEILNATIVYQSITGLYESRRKLGE
ncbi:type II CRISPR RNA-guided endonuclease Cas9 [Listeria sp. ILCC792]|uniref:type II CRISPR RNA-guided endonuclease Cas9 n=1 Tax=Listeria sp. ILCC792 TaxID=1918331 RepID=UPI000B58B5A6|nr:type II CRISPR RNA-guided endonuclease Cas9 [Listeria sp. ILCC792]